MDRGYRRIIVCSVPLPTISDDAPRGEIAHARRAVSASLADRTKLTHRYNMGLRTYCSERGISFLHFEDELLDDRSGVIDHRFLNRDPLDHHLEPSALAPVLVEKLRCAGFR
jgi:hypothetical protein